MQATNRTLIESLRVLSREIVSDDGVASVLISNAAKRIEELEREVANLQGISNRQFETILKPSVN